MRAVRPFPDEDTALSLAEQDDASVRDGVLSLTIGALLVVMAPIAY